MAASIIFPEETCKKINTSGKYPKIPGRNRKKRQRVGLCPEFLAC